MQRYDTLKDRASSGYNKLRPLAGHILATRGNLVALVGIFVFVSLAGDPVMAQAGEPGGDGGGSAVDACSGPFYDLMELVEGYLGGYGWWLLFIGFIIGGILYVFDPAFEKQNGVGAVMMMGAMLAAIFIIFGAQFFGTMADLSGLGSSCSTIVTIY